MGIFRDRKDSAPPPAYDATMAQSSASGSGRQQMSNNLLGASASGPSNPPLKPGMAGYTYAEIPPPPADQQVGVPIKQDPRQEWQVGPQQPMQYGEMSPQGPVMHWYRNANGHVIQSPLPPSHPAMQCLMQGRHVPETRRGILGILIGVLFCPIGCVALALDYSVRCKRCGETLDEGCYSC